MTVSIHLEDRTAEALQARADALGLSLDQYIRQIAEQDAAVPRNGSVEQACEDFDAALDELFANESQSLPATSLTYSRDDIYLEHD